MLMNINKTTKKRDETKRNGNIGIVSHSQF